MPPRLREALALIPALAALGIAVLYTAGAIVKSGQLRGAGMNVRDTLPLVPLQQILTLGIGTLVASIAWFVSLAFVLWLYLFKFKDWGFGEPWTISPRAMRWWNLFGVGGYVLLIGGLVYWFWVQPFFSAVAWSATFLIGIFAAQTHRGRRYVATALAVLPTDVVNAADGWPVAE